eukprot:783374-Prymnesium_polylepis.1
MSQLKQNPIPCCPATAEKTAGVSLSGSKSISAWSVCMSSATVGSLSDCKTSVLIVEYLSGRLSMMSAVSCSSVKQRRE